jgi:hypothetical protein
LQVFHLFCFHNFSFFFQVLHFFIFILFSFWIENMNPFWILNNFHTWFFLIGTVFKSEHFEVNFQIGIII